MISSRGPPRQLIDAAKAGTFDLVTSEALLLELLDVLGRGKFSARLQAAQLKPQGIVDDLRKLAIVVAPSRVPRIVANDPDDDHVLACALAGSADFIVSGDHDLLDLGSYQDIPIATARGMTERINI